MDKVASKHEEQGLCNDPVYGDKVKEGFAEIFRGEGEYITSEDLQRADQKIKAAMREYHDERMVRFRGIQHIWLSNGGFIFTDQWSNEADIREPQHQTLISAPGLADYADTLEYVRSEFVKTDHWEDGPGGVSMSRKGEK